VRLILQPCYPKPIGRPTGTTLAPSEHLAYVQYFTYAHVTQQGQSGSPTPLVDPALNMYEVRRSNRSSCMGRVPKGDIIPLSSMWQPIQLIPKFNGGEADRSLTCDNVLDKCAAFYINSFSDNQVYQTVY
jgi:hypothetical protein